MPGGHDCRHPGVSPGRQALLKQQLPWTLSARGKHLRWWACVTLSAFLPALLEGGALTGMLGWNPVHRWPGSVTKDQRSSESVFQPKQISCKYVCVFFKKCWSMMGRSFYPLLTDLLKTRNCLNWAPWDLTIKWSSLPNFRNSPGCHTASVRASSPLSSTSRSQLPSPCPTKTKREFKG